MSMSSDQLFETVLSLPQPRRADLAFQLLQSLELPGEEISPEQFGAELHERIASSRRGDIQGHSIEEAREIVKDRLSKGRQQ